jgi:hypothetical protein
MKRKPGQIGRKGKAFPLSRGQSPFHPHALHTIWTAAWSIASHQTPCHGLSDTAKRNFNATPPRGRFFRRLALKPLGYRHQDRLHLQGKNRGPQEHRSALHTHYVPVALTPESRVPSSWFR